MFHNGSSNIELPLMAYGWLRRVHPEAHTRCCARQGQLCWTTDWVRRPVPVSTQLRGLPEWSNVSLVVKWPVSALQLYLHSMIRLHCTAYGQHSIYYYRPLARRCDQSAQPLPAGAFGLKRARTEAFCGLSQRFQARTQAVASDGYSAWPVFAL
jgi:hypothetical protein